MVQNWHITETETHLFMFLTCLLSIHSRLRSIIPQLIFAYQQLLLELLLNTDAYLLKNEYLTFLDCGCRCLTCGGS